MIPSRPKTLLRATGLRALAPLLLASSLPLLADEGMWMPQQIPDLSPRLREMGFEADPGQFADLTGQPMGAVIQLPGCSASFISPDGLIATNHHCVVGSLQYNSKPEKNLIKEGYLARTLAEELWNGPGSRASVTVSVREVTDEITGKIDPKLTDRQRYALLETRVKERTAACEKDGLRCRVASFFEGLRYFEIAQLEIQDVRLVYAPAEGVGNFGGETDNWQWPRHTGDFSLYRAYVGKDGKSAAHSDQNVPYKPKRWLKVSPKGASPGDLIFVAGYPGSTRRHATYAEIKDMTEWQMPRFLKRSKDVLAILDEVGKKSKETQIKTASMVRGLNNSLTNRTGVLKGLTQGGLLALKEARDKELRAWIDADAKRKKDYGDVLPAMDALHTEELKTRERDSALGGLYQSSQLLGTARNLYRLSLERVKKDADREPEMQERNWQRMKDSLDRMDRSLDVTADRAVLRYALTEYAKLAADQRIPALDKAVGLSAGMTAENAAKSVDAFLDRLYVEPRLAKKDERLKLFSAFTKELVDLKDPFFELAIALHPLSEELRERDKKNAGAMQRLRPRYMKALLEKSGGLLAPDANSTLRVTYGKVEGVASKDGLFFLPQTTLAGISQKHTGEGEFNAPKKVLDAIAMHRGGKTSPYTDPKLNDVPVDFLATVDTTGGNSGSAALNARGELVGLLFDGTYETVASDYLYDTVKTRSIVVDTRYLLWTLTEVEQAHNLLDELGIPSK